MTLRGWLLFKHFDTRQNRFARSYLRDSSYNPNPTPFAVFAH
jgi:hypothetical protein